MGTGMTSQEKKLRKVIDDLQQLDDAIYQALLGVEETEGRSLETLLSVLLSALKDAPHVELRLHAAQSLKRILECIDDPLLEGICKPLLEGIADPEPSVVACVLEALGVMVAKDECLFFRRQAFDGVVTALANQDLHIRTTAVKVLKHFISNIHLHRDASKSYSSEVLSIIAKMAKEDEIDVRMQAVENLSCMDGRLASDVIPVLVDLIRENAVAVRVLTMRALTRFGIDAASKAVPVLTNALSDGDLSIRQTALTTLAELGIESIAAIPEILKVMLHDQEEELRVMACRSLLTIDPGQKDLVLHLENIQDISSQELILNILREIGPEGRSLRRAIQEAWSGGRKEEAGEPVAAPGTKRRSQFKKRLSDWAVGIENDKSWHLFKKWKGEFQPQRKLVEIRGGVRARLLKGFAEKGGALSKAEAINLVRPHCAPSEMKAIIKKVISPELSHLRKILLKAIGESDSDVDPIPIDPNTNSWQAIIEIGYAIQEDQPHIGGEERLRFKTREQLTRHERLELPR